MKKLYITSCELQIIDSYFKTNFYRFSMGMTDKIFSWTHDINNMDLDIMFEDLKRSREFDLNLYFQKYKLKSSITFINSLLVYFSLPRLQYIYTVGPFRYYQY